MARIVIADDHHFFRMGLQAGLERAGHKVVASAADGTAALTAIRDLKPDAALLDVRMEGMSGIEVLGAMRAAGETCPVIALTAELSDEALIGLMKARVEGIVFKDGSEQDLFAAIATVLRGERHVAVDLMEKAMGLLLRGSPVDRMDSLTLHERRIAQSVARGFKNRTIAGQLGVTEGTVKVHLHRIYKKLGISSRTELVVLMSEQDRIVASR